MSWYVVKLSEDEFKTLINYSYEGNDKCDGLIEYDKENDSFTIVSLSYGSSEFNTKRLFAHLYGLLDGNKLTKERRRIAIG